MHVAHGLRRALRHHGCPGGASSTRPKVCHEPAAGNSRSGGAAIVAPMRASIPARQTQRGDLSLGTPEVGREPARAPDSGKVRRVPAELRRIGIRQGPAGSGTRGTPRISEANRDLRMSAISPPRLARMIGLCRRSPRSATPRSTHVPVAIHQRIQAAQRDEARIYDRRLVSGLRPDQDAAKPAAPRHARPPASGAGSPRATSPTQAWRSRSVAPPRPPGFRWRPPRPGC